MKLSHKQTLKLLKRYKFGLLALASVFVVCILVLIAVCYLVIESYSKFIITQVNSKHANVGLVLGAGVAKNGKPYKELQARLDKSADALKKGTVSKLILSGDNRFKNYNEPTVMFNYLTKQKNIPANKLQRDFAGRSTYESCERASKIFRIKKTIIFSAQSHLPRAIYLCRHFGIESYGIGSGVEANNSTRRELLARVKAVYNIHLVGENTVLGQPIPLE